MQFTITHQDPRSQARTGVITTDHGTIPTPIFMPVGTQGSVKGVHQRELMEDLDAPIILANTYHLYLRPGEHVLARSGGLHRFMHWDRALLTDSGGYQVYSLGHRRKITEEGVCFASHIDGSKHVLTPERAIDIQRAIGADIIMAFDECTPFPCTYDYAKLSMERTHRWLKRCQDHLAQRPARYGHSQALFPIVQGGVYKELRRASAEAIIAAQGAGNAIGGVCHPTGQLDEVVGWVCDLLPPDKPRYLMGVGTPRDLLASIASGVDMFDCVMPTRNGRNGTLFTREGMINIKNKKWREDPTPVDPLLDGYVSRFYSKGYLHHLMRTGERLGAQIATLQNLSFYLWLVRQARRQIEAGLFTFWKEQLLPIVMRKR